MIKEAVDRLYKDLAFAAPEMWGFHMERRMQEVADQERERWESAILEAGGDQALAKIGEIYDRDHPEEER